MEIRLNKHDNLSISVHDVSMSELDNTIPELCWIKTYNELYTRYFFTATVVFNGNLSITFYTHDFKEVVQ